MITLLAAVVLTLSAAWLTVITGLVIPLLTGLATKLEASKVTKTAVTVVLAAAAGVLQSVVADQGVVTDQTAINAAITLGVALLSFYGIYGPAGTDTHLAPGRGIG